MTPGADDIRRDLELAAARATGVLRRERASIALRRATDGVSAWAWLPLLFVLAAAALGGPAADLCLVCAAACVAAGALVVADAVLRSRRVDVRDALARLDADLATADRLLTAHEFLAAPHPSAFMQAAIEDAADALARAGATPQRPRAAAIAWSRRGRLGVALAAVLLGLARVVAPATLRPPTINVSAAPTADGAATSGQVTDDSDRPRPTVPPAPDRGARRDRPTATGLQASEEGPAGEIPDDSRETEGATGEGRSAEASSARGAGQSKGTPSTQGQVSVPPEREAKARKRRPSAAPDAAPAPQRKPEKEERSGSTAGSGAASGSNRNPSTSEWSSKDQITETDDEPVSEDEDVDDEESDSEARGGVQPNLRDRRPPVNRDLAVGFGNEPDEESNGRGGPGRQKKSRGTASLVLGVPIPDHVKGQPNPGRTKITQERVEPKEDDAPDVVGTGRGARTTPAGVVPRAELSPWMRALVRAYFLGLRRGPESGPRPTDETPRSPPNKDTR